MCITKGFLSAAVSLAAAVGLAATIEVSQAKQRYPWNGLVDMRGLHGTLVFVR